MDLQLNLAAADGSRIQKMTYTDNAALIRDGDTVAGRVRPQHAADVLCAHIGFQKRGAVYL